MKSCLYTLYKSQRIENVMCRAAILPLTGRRCINAQQSQRGDICFSTKDIETFANQFTK